jgi:hypothetical protein
LFYIINKLFCIYSDREEDLQANTSVPYNETDDPEQPPSSHSTNTANESVYSKVPQIVNMVYDSVRCTVGSFWNGRNG